MADLGIELSSLFLGFGKGQSGVNAGAFVAGFAEPGVLENSLFFGDEFQDLRCFGAGAEEGVGGGGVLERFIGAEINDDRAGHEPMADFGGVYAVCGKFVTGLEFLLIDQKATHGSMDVENGPAFATLGQQPLGITAKNFVVVSGRCCLGFCGAWVVDRRSEVNYPGTDFCGGLSQVEDTVLEGLESGFIEGQVDAIIHAVTGDDKVGLGFGEDAFEPLREIGSWESASSVTGFGEAGDGFAGEAEVEDFALPLRFMEVDKGLNVSDVEAAVGDAVAEEEDPTRDCRFGSWCLRLG